MTVLLVLVPMRTRAQSELTGARVLVLHSYHQGFTWTDQISRGIEEAFAPHAADVELIFEFMDTRRWHDEGYFEALHAIYRHKYAGRPVDVVIAADDQALDYLLGAGQEILAGVPIVFCSVSGYDPALRQRYEITGLMEDIDIEETLDLALDLHPDVHEIAVITDMTRTGQALKARSEAILARREDPVSFRYLEHETVDELLPKVAALDEGTILFLFIFSSDRDGRVISHEHRLQVLAPYSRVPIYSIWDFYLGHGIVGGKLTSGLEEGRRAGAMALRILQGEAARQIPLQASPSRYAFDYGQLQRFDIDPARLPAGSVIVNQPSSIYDEYGTVILVVAALIVFLLGVVAVLSRANLLRRRAEEALRRERDLLDRTMQTSPAGIVVVDRHGEITFANERAEAVLGVTRSVMEGRAYNAVEWGITDYDGQLLPDRDLPLSRVTAMGRPVAGVRHAIHRPDGQRVLLSINAAPLFDDHGQVDGMVATVDDVTQEVRAVEAMREESYFRSAIIARAAEGLCVCHDVDEYPFVHFTVWNHRMEEITGYNREEINELGWYQTVYPDPETQERARERMERMRYGDDLVGEEWTITRADGEPAVLLISTSLLLGADGEAHVLALMHDISDRQRAEQALQRRARELAALNAVGRHVGASLSVEQVVRAALEEVRVPAGADLAILFQRAGNELQLQDMVAVDEAYRNEDAPSPGVGECICGLAAERGEPLYVRDIHNDPCCTLARCRDARLHSFAALPLRSGDEVIGVLGLASAGEKDFRESAAFLETLADQVAAGLQNALLHREVRRYASQLEQRVAERTAQLEAVNRELEAFAYSVSHDLRAPLRSIDGFSQALLEDYGDVLQGRGGDYLRRVRAASQRMGQLIDDLLALSRLVRSGLRLELVHMSALARTIAAELQASEPERQVEFVIADRVLATGDARLLRVVLENLLGNAWKFTVKRPTARIEFGTCAVDGATAYFVRDNGAGFDMAYADKLFSAFQRLHGVQEFEGTGIGLATVRRVIHRHGGRVWAEGAVGQGAIFYFTLGDDGEML